MDATGLVTDEREGEHQPQSVTAQVSRAVVLAMKQRIGRGPGHVATTITGDQVLVICRGCLTEPERALIEAGQVEDVRRMRASLERMMKAELEMLVGDIVDARVVASFSDYAFDQDLAAKVFLLDKRS